MTYFDYSDADYPIRDDIGAAHRAYWKKLASPGAWWTGAERVAIASESRNALVCGLCSERKTALSSYGSAGKHDHDDLLSEVAVDAIHRIVTDQSRISQKYVNDNVEGGLSKPAYVELVGVVVATFSIDEFHRSLGLVPEDLPKPHKGQISRYLPKYLTEDMGYVPTIRNQRPEGDEADLWPGDKTANVVRALSLVPDAVRDWRELGGAHYLSFDGMQNFGKDDSRALNRMQIELVAARVSAINQCFY